MAGGHSKVNFCRAIKKAGALVKDVFVIFDYDTFPTKTLRDTMQVTMHSLATWRDILAAARESSTFQARELAELETFLVNPVHWSHVHGGICSFKDEKSELA